MRVVVDIKFNNLDAIARKLGKIAGDAVEETLDEMKGLVQSGMAASSPPPSAPGDMPAIDTGQLIASLTTEMEGQTNGALYTEVDYAPYLEYGTSRMQPRPFFTPAAEEAKGILSGKLTNLESKLG